MAESNGKCSAADRACSSVLLPLRDIMSTSYRFFLIFKSYFQVFLFLFLYLQLYLVHILVFFFFFLRPSSPLLLRLDKDHQSSFVPCCQPEDRIPIRYHDGLLRRPLLRPCNVLAPHQHLCCRDCSWRTMYRELHTMFTTRSHEQCCASTGRCLGRPLL